MHYDIGRMANWFGSRRKRLRMKERKEQAPNDTNNDSRKSSSSSLVACSSTNK